tara:strand:- start:68 stop:442 length:375 start_codon:yes stop_codon:yes gene_type:complete
MPVSPPIAEVVSVQEAQPNEGLDLEASPVVDPVVVVVDAEPDRESVDARSRIGLTMCGGFCLFLSGSVIVCASIFMSKKLVSHTLGVAALKFAIGPCLIGDGLLLYRYRDKVKDTIASYLEDWC